MRILRFTKLTRLTSQNQLKTESNVVAVSVKLAGTTAVVLRQETRPPAAGGVCRAAQGDSVQQFCPQPSPFKHQLSSELELHPNTSWAQS